MRMVLKVQSPQFVDGGGLPAYLVYNEDRSIRTILPLGDNALLDKAMKREPVQFFFVEALNAHDELILHFDFDTPCDNPGW